MSGTFSLYQTILALIMKDIQINYYHQTCNTLFINKIFIHVFLYVDTCTFLFDSLIFGQFHQQLIHAQKWIKCTSYVTLIHFFVSLSIMSTKSLSYLFCFSWSFACVYCSYYTDQINIHCH